MMTFIMLVLASIIGSVVGGVLLIVGLAYMLHRLTTDVNQWEQWEEDELNELSAQHGMNW